MANPYRDVPYDISQNFGPTDFTAEPAFRGFPHYHEGADLVSRPGHTHPNIYATTRQQIFAYGTDTDGANYVITDDGQGCFHAYWHLNSILSPAVGTWVEPGVQPLGTEGTSGFSTSDHLHYEVQQKTPYGHSLHNPNNPIDPSPYLDNAQGGAEDLNPRQLVESLYDLLVGARPAEDVLAAKAQYVADNGPQQVIKDLIDAGSRYLSQKRALSTYQQARLDAGGGLFTDGTPYPADTFADDRISGGSSFQDVIHGDLQFYVNQQKIAQELLGKDIPAPLSDIDKQDLQLGQTLRSYMKGLK